MKPKEYVYVIQWSILREGYRDYIRDYVETEDEVEYYIDHCTPKGYKDVTIFRYQFDKELDTWLK